MADRQLDSYASALNNQIAATKQISTPLSQLERLSQTRAVRARALHVRTPCTPVRKHRSCRSARDRRERYEHRIFLLARRLTAALQPLDCRASAGLSSKTKASRSAQPCGLRGPHGRFNFL